MGTMAPDERLERLVIVGGDTAALRATTAGGGQSRAAAR